MKMLGALGLSAFLVFQGSASAQDAAPKPDPAALKLARSILDATHASDNIELGLDAMVPVTVETLKRDRADIPAAVIQKFIVIFRDDMRADIPHMLDIEAELYARHYTVTELEAISQFYESDVGKKVIRETPLILKETIPLGRAWGRETGARAMRDTLTKLRAQGVKI